MSHRWEAGFTDEIFDACEAAVGHKFADRSYLRNSLTHASGASNRLESNERLEFLGDAILGMLVCDLLYRRYPEETEGELTRIKSVVVSRTTCAKISVQLRLVDWLMVGKGLGASDELPPSVAAAVFESLVAGVYLDGGIDAARTFVEKYIGPEIEAAAELEHGRNFKSLLQQVSQKSLGATPVYRLIDEKGPDHSKCFKVAAVIGPQAYSAAWGPNKKAAEQRAAQNALHELEGRPIPHGDE